MSEPALTPAARVRPLLERGQQWLWRDLDQAGPATRAGMRVLRTCFAVGRDLAEGQLTLRAMSLVYTTLLALVPLLAISFSILKGFGVHNQIEPFLLNLLEPLGERSEEITDQIVDFVDNVQVGVLGTVGFLLLFYAAVSLMRKIELAFNETWQVTRERSLAERFRDYFSVILLGPVLMFVSVGMTATLMSSTAAEWLLGIDPLGRLAELLSRLTPIIMVIFAFTFINMFVPNTRVRFGSALIGGAASGVLWHGMGMLFAAFVAGAGRYTAIYSGFATPIFFMIWLYLGWLILLIGGTLSFYHQHPEYLPGRRQLGQLSFVEREHLTLHILRLIGESFYGRRPPPSAQWLARRLRVPVDVVDELLGSLMADGLVAPTLEDMPGFLPACPWEEASVHMALEAVRHGTREDPGERLAPGEHPQVHAVLATLERLSREAFGQLSLREFVTSGERLSGEWLTRDGDRE